MNELTWLTTKNLRPMLAYILDPVGKGHVTFRKMRLLACAWRRMDGRVVWSDASGWHTNEIDGQPCAYDGSTCQQQDRAAYRDARHYSAIPEHDLAVWTTQIDVMRDIIGNPWKPFFTDEMNCCRCDNLMDTVLKPQASFVCPKCGDIASMRDTFESAITQNRVLPFKYITPVVKDLALAAFEQRERPNVAFDGTLDDDRLLILADALEDAGLPGIVPCHTCDCGRPGEYTPDDGWNVPEKCKPCGGTGKVLNPFLKDLRNTRPRFRGYEVLDVILGRW